MFCKQCGKELADGAVFCTNCGTNTTVEPVAPATPAPVQPPKTKQVDPADAPNTGMFILGFFIPIAGLILYLINMDTKPQMAKSAGKGALIGYIASTVFGVIMGVLATILPVVLMALGVY